MEFAAQCSVSGDRRLLQLFSFRRILADSSSFMCCRPSAPSSAQHLSWRRLLAVRIHTRRSFDRHDYTQSIELVALDMLASGMHSFLFVYGEILTETSYRTHGVSIDKVGADKNIKTSNKNLAQDKFTETDVVHTTTSYFDPVWNVFSHHTDGSIQWIPKQIVGIGCRNVNLI